MVADPQRQRRSVEEYLAFDRTVQDVHYEYIDGYMLSIAS